MYFLNTGEIDMLAERHQSHPILGKATRFLQRFRDIVDNNSDGWCYWRLPVNAAKKLMVLIHDCPNPTETELKKALIPIRSFCTRHKLPCPEIN